MHLLERPDLRHFWFFYKGEQERKKRLKAPCGIRAHNLLFCRSALVLRAITATWYKKYHLYQRHLAIELPPLLSRSGCRSSHKKRLEHEFHFVSSKASFVKSRRQVIDYAIDFRHGPHKKYSEKVTTVFFFAVKRDFLLNRFGLNKVFCDKVFRNGFKVRHRFVEI